MKFVRGNRANNPSDYGAIAQLGERVVRNDEAVGSIPTSSTKLHLRYSSAVRK
jgi:hypothetical protein